MSLANPTELLDMIEQHKDNDNEGVLKLTYVIQSTLRREIVLTKRLRKSCQCATEDSHHCNAAILGCVQHSNFVKVRSADQSQVTRNPHVITTEDWEWKGVYVRTTRPAAHVHRYYNKQWPPQQQK